MRPIKELLEIVLKEVVGEEYMDRPWRERYSCLCEVTYDLRDTDIITHEEFLFIDKYLFDNRPDDERTVYYWPKGDMIVRKEWLTKQIEKL